MIDQTEQEFKIYKINILRDIRVNIRKHEAEKATRRKGNQRH